MMIRRPRPIDRIAIGGAVLPVRPVRVPGLRPARRLQALLLALACCGFLPTTASAELADRDQPTTVEAERMQYDDTTRTNVFSGNVVLNRGTLRIRSDRMVLRQDAAGFQTGTATGRPATFRQKREGTDEWVEGQAEELEYDGRRETVRLLRDARVRRTQGSQVLDEIEGGLIVYDTRAEQFAVEGSPAGALTGGRVRITIQPRPEPADRPGRNPEAQPGAAAPSNGGMPLRPAERPATGAR
jgi:lipopolysaccharide export system protein LptA